MSPSLIDSVAILTAMLLLIFAAFAFSYKKGKIASHKILSAFLLSNALYIIDFSLGAIEDSTGLNLHWFNGIGSAFGFLFGPLLYLYAKSITNKDFSLRPTDAVHLIIFMAALLTVLFPTGIPFVYRYSALFLQTTPYLIACFILILRYRKEIKDYYSTTDKLNLTWMLYVVGAFFFMWMVDLSDFTLASFGAISEAGDSRMVFLSLAINFAFAILIFYKALQHPEIFAGFPENEKHRKYEKSHLTKNEKQDYLRRLEQYFTDKKPFLNPELTINDVANAISVPPRYLSQVINEALQKNFYDLINSYRIEEAKRKLKSDDDPKRTVLEVLYDSGFNSKSAFNTAFKKHTGYTPTQFKRATS